MLENAEQSPLKFHFGAPSCVPATSFETAGAQLGLAEVETLLDDPRINHLSEMMNFPGVLAGDLDVMAKITAARARGLPIDGHAPGLSGTQAARYIQAGISTDHECVELAEAEHKIRCGAKIAIREGSAARNFDALWPLIDKYPDHCMLCSDDKHPDDLVAGHINQLVARAVQRGADVINVLRAACVNPVKHYRLDVGLLQVEDPADFVICEDLEQFAVRETYIDGRLVASRGKSLVKSVPAKLLNQFSASPIELESLRVGVSAQAGANAKIRVIDVADGQIVTGSGTVDLPVGAAEVTSRVDLDVMKLVVVNRYQDRPPAVGFVRGFRISRGAFASSVAHDSHNVIAVGENDEDLRAAINAVILARGGLAVSCQQRTLVLPLPVAGLMSDETCAVVAEKYVELDSYVKACGCGLKAPFMTLSFLALPVIPTLKLTDKGLFDVVRYEFLSLLCGV